MFLCSFKYKKVITFYNVTNTCCFLKMGWKMSCGGATSTRKGGYRPHTKFSKWYVSSKHLPCLRTLLLVGGIQHKFLRFLEKCNSRAIDWPKNWSVRRICSDKRARWITSLWIDIDERRKAFDRGGEPAYVTIAKDCAIFDQYFYLVLSRI